MIKRKKNLFLRLHQNTRFQKFESVLLPLLLGVLLLILWQTQALHAILHTDTFTLPLPTRIVSIIGDNLPVIWKNIQATLLVAVAGLAVGSLLGYLIAIVAAIFPRWGKGRG